jgi:probable rRNA maturation factor
MIELSYDPDSPELPQAGILEAMAEAASAAAEAHGVADAEISLTFVSPDRMMTLNRDHRGIDDVTDVLSFAQSGDGEFAHGDAGQGDGAPALLGDVVICTDRAMEQAAEYGHGAERELVYLFVHGLLHLLGYDHDEDGRRAGMRGAEESVMRKVNL